MVDQSIACPMKVMANASEGDRSGRARIVILLLCLGLAAAALLSLTSGASDASAINVLRDWLFGAIPSDAALNARDSLIIYDIRLPRIILGMVVCAALSVSGAGMQGLLRNWLADSGLIGGSAIWQASSTKAQWLAKQHPLLDPDTAWPWMGKASALSSEDAASRDCV